jgi:hypothetical protein
MVLTVLLSYNNGSLSTFAHLPGVLIRMISIELILHNIEIIYVFSLIFIFKSFKCLEFITEPNFLCILIYFNNFDFNVSITL